MDRVDVRLRSAPPVLLVLPLLLAACDDPSAREPGAPGTGSRGAAVAEAALFVDRAAAAGLDFVQFNGMSGQYYMAEVTGSGAALFDYDGDGDLDAFLVQGQMLEPGADVRRATFPPPAGAALADRLFRNDLDGGPPSSLRFTDVTAAAGFGARADGYGMGVTTGDYDNDGRTDLYVTNFGPNRLWRNRGDGTFEDVTAASGTGEDRWSVPAAFFDFDRDGWLDLYVGNYIAEDLEERTICRDFTGAQDYCGPGAFESHPDRLFRNRGDGTFEDVTERAGLAERRGAALGVVAADFDGDGWLDLYVANDSQPNFLWINRRDGTFEEAALLAGAAVNATGKAEASMGVDAADYDGDGDLDLFMTHLTGETNTLYANDGRGVFDDATTASGLGPPSRPYTSFGTAWIDYDNDGDPDLLIANGAVKRIEALARAGDPFPLHQPNQLFRNLGGGRFEEVTDRAGEVFALSEVSRGAAFGDVDDDGDLDVLLVSNSGPVRLLINRVGSRQPWIGLRLTGSSGRDMLGARVELLLRGRPPRVARVRTDGSFASASDPRVLFGLGGPDAPPAEAVSGVRVLWPDGSVEAFGAPPAGRYTTLLQGGGSPSPEGEAP